MFFPLISFLCICLYNVCVCFSGDCIQELGHAENMLPMLYHWSYDHNLSNSFFFKKISNLAHLCKSYCFNSLFKYNFSCDSSRKN